MMPLSWRTAMAAQIKPFLVPTEVVRDPSVMSGEPVIRGTRILAETILTYLRSGSSRREIFADYPSLPVDSIEAVAAWAKTTYGPNWQSPVGRGDALR
jgi:uncharacterized protein (DUF433 family)